MPSLRPAQRLPYRTAPLPQGLHPALWDCTGFALAQVARAGDTLLAARLQPLGLTPPLFAVLLLLEADGPLLQARLGEALAMDKAAVARLVDALEASDLARRTANPSDARSVLVALRPGARPLLRAARKVEREAREHLTATLDAKERAELHRLLREVAVGLGPLTGSGST